jgi:hypothetical protein
MALVKDFSTFRRYVRFNQTATDINSMLDTGPAEREYILPILGHDLYNALVTQVQNNNVTLVQLLDIVQAAVVPLTVFKELPFLQTQLGDTGLRNLLSDNTQSAFRWQYNEVRDAFEDKGCKALDELYNYLYNNAVVPAWTAPERLSIVFKTGSDFHKYYRLKYPERTFRTIEDVIRDVEEQYLAETIGGAFLKVLVDKSNPDTDEKEAILLIKKACANLSIMKAIEKKPVRVTPGGLFVNIGDAVDDKNPKEKTASYSQLQMQRNAVECDGESYLTRLKSFLNEKASADLFAAYYASSYYENPATTTNENPNSNRKTFSF